jgi:hypothetical protein
MSVDINELSTREINYLLSLKVTKFNLRFKSLKIKRRMLKDIYTQQELQDRISGLRNKFVVSYEDDEWQ